MRDALLSILIAAVLVLATLGVVLVVNQIRLWSWQRKYGRRKR